jgi:bifunctional non-homologous end joining protein LigD
VKFDGYRIQARIDGGKIKILTRSGLDWSPKFQSIAAALRDLQIPSALLDGEIVVNDDGGVSNFSALQQDLKAGRMDRMVYYAFDLLYLDGMDLRGASLVDRKAALALLIDDVPAGGPIRYSEHITEDGELLTKHACQIGLEGIISKRADQGYRSGRGDHWTKRKCTLRQELVVVGYLPSSTGTKAIGALILAYYEKGKLIPAGKVGTGFTNEMARSLWQTLSPLGVSAAPFDKKRAGSYRGARWVRPEIVAEVEFSGWTHENTLRHASFKGVRDDKKSAGGGAGNSRSTSHEYRKSQLRGLGCCSDHSSGSDSLD